LNGYPANYLKRNLFQFSKLPLGIVCPNVMDIIENNVNRKNNFFHKMNLRKSKKI